VKTGFFLTVEGVDGAGKTTVVAMIRDFLAESGREATITREPGGSPAAERIRGLLLDRSSPPPDPRAEALLYAAARRQHLVDVVIPALRAGRIVVCDRYVDSSLAYQGYARGLGVEEVWSINRFAVEHWMPDLTLYLDVPPETGLARIRRDAARETNRIDLESLDFHRKVRQGYLMLAERHPGRIVTISADRPLEDVFRDVRLFLEKRLFS